MKILVTGARGQVGRELSRRAARGSDGGVGVGPGAGVELVGLGRGDLDIRDAVAVSSAVDEHAPGLVVNAAAYTAVDAAEKDAPLAFAINRDGAANVAHACARARVALVHLSTDYVFDGRKGEPYCEDDAVAPLGVYARSKWEGEEAVRRELGEHIILRTSWVFSAHRRNFVKTLLGLRKERDEFRVVDDQRGCPTAASDLARVLLELAGRLEEAGGSAECEFPWGLYHYCGSPATSWFGFARAVFAEAERCGAMVPPRLEAIATGDYPVAAPRPPCSEMDCSRIRTRFGVEQRPWAQGLADVVRELLPT
ncbi:MAG: dTDP-4-dehydrorhamnose reductase [Candidatus Binatia bacterium]